MSKILEAIPLVGRLSNRKKFNDIAELNKALDYVSGMTKTLAPVMTFNENGKDVPFLPQELFEYSFVLEVGAENIASKIVHKHSEEFKTINQNDFVFHYDKYKRDFVASQYQDGICIDTIEGRKEMVKFIKDNYDKMHSFENDYDAEKTNNLSI